MLRQVYFLPCPAVGIVLKMARLMKTGSSNGQADIFNSVNKPPTRTLIIPSRELVQVMAKVNY